MNLPSYLPPGRYCVPSDLPRHAYPVFSERVVAASVLSEKMRGRARYLRAAFVAAAIAIIQFPPLATILSRSLSLSDSAFRVFLCFQLCS